MVAIDTNILVRFLVRDDETLYRRAAQIMERAQPASLLLDRIIITELGYVLRAVYGCTKADVALAYQGLLADDRFSITDRELTERAVDLFGSQRPLSLEDCWLLALRQAGKVTHVATFDTALAKRTR